MAITVRSYIVDENGTLRFLSKRLGIGIHLGEDAIPEFAGTRQKVVDVIIENEDGKPVRIIDAKGAYWHFDDQGHLDLDDLRQRALDMVDFGEPLTSGNLIDIQAQLRRRQFAAKFRWEVSGDLLDRIAADIWGGKEVPGAIESVHGIAPLKPPLTHAGREVFDEIESALIKVLAKIDALSEPALKGLAFKMRETEKAGDWALGVWESLAGQVDFARTVKARHRTGKGTWHAVLTVWLKRPFEFQEVVRKSTKCDGRTAAVEAGRKFLIDNARYLESDTELQIDVITDLEFNSDPANRDN